MKLTVDVTDPELGALEDVLIVWNLCPTHASAAVRANREKIGRWQYGCSRCRGVLDQKVKRSLGLWSKLCRAHDGV